ncbi:MAG TPA: N(G),N(G)-dimethylarginine dimethylaminohydrolase, partial [Albitalea sp.]
MRTALTRPPTPAIARCELTYLERRPIDPAEAAAEHRALERALAGLGCRVLRLPPLPDLPDAAFVEDVAVVLDEVAVVTRPGAASRRPETEGLDAVLAPFRPVRSIRPPGTLDGGDVLRTGRMLRVGRSRRTNADGIAQLRDAVRVFGYRVEPVNMRGCLHLRTAACALEDDTLLVNPAWVDARALGDLAIVEVDAR